MDDFLNLEMLLQGNQQAKRLFDGFSMDAQIALQLQGEQIHSLSDMKGYAAVLNGDGGKRK